MSFDLYAELTRLLASFDAEGIDYALCGGLALAVYGNPRATVDIDLLVLEDDVERALGVAEALGFAFRAEPMAFSDGDVQIRRISKIDPDTGEPIPLDLLTVTGNLETIWKDRRKVQWEAGDLWVASREGLIELKRMRSSAQDLADIEHLTKTDDA